MHRAQLLALAALAPLGLQACRGCSTESSIVAENPTADETSWDHDWGSWLSMGVLPDGSPVAAYYDRTRTALGFAVGAVGDDGTVEWTHEEVDGYPDESGLDSGDRGTYASLAVAGDGTVWVAYRDETNHVLRTAVRDPDGNWTTGVADTGSGASPDSGKYASIALDPSGNPAIAHYDVARGELRIATWNGSSFAAEVVDDGLRPAPDTGGAETDADVGRFARLRIAPDGTFYIAYYDATEGDLRLAWGEPGNWSTEAVATEGDVGQWPDLLVDDGTLHVTFHDVGDQDLEYATGTPGAWTLETIDSGDHVGADSALYRDGDYLAVVYFDGRGVDAKRAWRGESGWQVETLAGDDGRALGFHNEVVVLGGTPWHGCYDYTGRTLHFAAIQ